MFADELLNNGDVLWDTADTITWVTNLKDVRHLKSSYRKDENGNYTAQLPITSQLSRRVHPG